MQQPRHPIFIISKGRADSRLTSKSLEEMGVDYRIVIEPQEYDQYAAVIDPNKIPSSLTGKPVKVIPKTPKAPAAAKQTTVVQNITVNASNTNDISKKMARAAKTGIPIGGKP